MKKLLCVLLSVLLVVGLMPVSVLAADGITIDAVYFPDAVFRAYVDATFDTTDDDVLDEQEIAAAKIINLNNGYDGGKVQNLTGIEHFTALEELYLDNNNLTWLDLSANTALTRFSCEGNVFEIEPGNDGPYGRSYNPRWLPGGGFDPSKAKEWAAVPSGQLFAESYDIFFDADVSQITYRYDCGNDKKITFAWQVSLPDYNEVEINEQNFPDEVLRNYIKNTYDTAEPKGVLDAVEISNVFSINIEGQGLSDLTGIEHLPALVNLYVRNNQLTEIDVSGNPALTLFYCSENQLTDLDISNLSELEYLQCGYNQLTTLDLHNNTKLVRVWCHNNMLTGINTTGLTALDLLYCPYNKLLSLDLSTNTALTQLEARNNCLTSLDLSHNNNLTDAWVEENTFTVDVDVDRRYDLRQMPNGFLMDQVNEWYGYETAEIVDTYFVEFGVGAEKMRYYYNCGNGFTLTCDLIPNYIYVNIDELQFPDTAFRNYLADTFDGDGDDKLSVAELAVIKTIDLPAAGVTEVANVKGIASLYALESFNCNNNKLTSLDISQNTALKTLSCSGNSLTSLNLGDHPSLQTLVCESNVAIIDLKQDKTFDLLDLPGDFLLEKASNFSTQEISGSIITAASGDTITYTYDTGKGVVTFALQVSGEVATNKVVINTKNFPDAVFSAYVSLHFDTDGNGELSETEIQNAREISISGSDLADLTGVEYLTELTNLNVSGNKLTALDLSQNTKLTVLNCSKNNISQLNVRNNTALRNLICGANHLTSLDLSANTKLFNLSCAENQLTELNVDNNTALEQFDCTDNQLRSVDITKLKQLRYLYCELNQISTLDLSQNTELRGLFCGQNQLIELNLQNNQKLEDLRCQVGQLTELDLSQNTALTSIECHYNQLTALDVSKNTELTSLQCNDNMITKLDVSKNQKLQMLQCSYNHMGVLDVSKNTSLEKLYCEHNNAGTVSMNMADRTCDLSGLYAKLETKGITPDMLTWSGGTVTGNTIKVAWGVDPITYTYDCGNGFIGSFDLYLDYQEDYHIYEEYQRQEIEKGNGADFRSNADFIFFWGVWINGELVDYRYYTTRQGSTIVVLKPEYINSLEPGGYTMSIVSQSSPSADLQTATTTFSVTGDPDPDLPDLPSDSNNPGGSGTPNPPIELTYRNDNFATATGEFQDTLYYGRAAREGDVLTLKVALSELGEKYGLDFTKIEVRYTVEGATQLTDNYLYTGDPVYVDGIATDFRLAKGFNKIVAHIYYNGFEAGECAPFYIQI